MIANYFGRFGLRMACLLTATVAFFMREVSAAPPGNYDASLGTLPTAQGWRLLETGSRSPSPVVGAPILRQGPTSFSGTQSWLRSDFSADFSSGANYGADLSLNVISSSYGAGGAAGTWRTGYFFTYVDNAGHMFDLGIAGSGIIISNNGQDSYAGSTQFISRPTTNFFHDYNVNINSHGLTLSIDGAAIPAASLALGPTGSAPGPFIQFGDESSSGNSMTELKSLTFSAPPPLLELAQMSQSVYQGNPSGIEGTLNFHGLQNLTADNLFANAYVNGFGNEIVVAFRGTQFLSAKDINADASFTAGAATPTLRLEASAAAQFVKQIQTQNPNAHITLTGHSLGGALAQLVGKAGNLDATVFNAPGAGALYGQLSDVLLVGSWNAPLGTVTSKDYRIFGDQVSLAGVAMGSQVTLQNPVSIVPDLNPRVEIVKNAGVFATLHSIDTVVHQIGSNAPSISTSGEVNLVPTLIDILQPANTDHDTTTWTDIMHFAFTIDSSLGALFDPPAGTDFVFTVQPGAPGITSVLLPIESGVASYAVRLETLGVWGSTSNALPGTVLSFGSGVNGVEFIPLNNAGGQAPISDFVFLATFDRAGAAAADLAVTAVPEPGSLALAAAASSCILLDHLRRKRLVRGTRTTR